jgi:hypothetical protein
LSARFIAFDCVFMQLCCHWQLMPMFRVTGSPSGGRASPALANVHNPTIPTRNAHLIAASNAIRSGNRQSPAWKTAIQHRWPNSRKLLF